eukprot:62845_1
MGAACVTTTPREQDEICTSNMDTTNKSPKDELLPLSPIELLFKVMSEEIGYDTLSLQSYCDKLRSLWIYRVIDVLNIDDLTWNKLEIPSVLEHVIRDYLNELKNTKQFVNYNQRSQTDIYVTFINKDIRTLFKQLLKSVNNLESAAKHIEYLEHLLTEKYLLNTDTLKKYMTKEEWNNINVPTNLKLIISKKINLNFNGETHTLNSNIIDDEKIINENENKPQGETLNDDKNDNDEEEEIPLVNTTTASGSSAPGLHNMSSVLSTKLQAIQIVKDDSDSDDEKEEQMVIINNMNVFNEMINKNINVKMNMMDIAKYYSNELLINQIIKVYNHFKYFVMYGYNTLYHLSFIPDELYEKLLLLTLTPNALKCELMELLTEIRNKYNDSMNNISHILPFKQNIYWEKKTFDAFKILSEDINLNLEKECNILMNNFYSNIWDWQFINNNILINELNGYNKYEIVRIRMQHMIKLCQYQYGPQNIPILPPIWKSQFNENLIIHKILQCDNGNNQSDCFHFDGLNWNEFTKKKIKIVTKYLDNNFVRKLQFLPIQHRKNNNLWNKLIKNNNISKHLRFKINFYSIKGLPNSDDSWINNYIHKHYKKLLPQFKQSMDINIITYN